MTHSMGAQFPDDNTSTTEIAGSGLRVSPTVIVVAVVVIICFGISAVTYLVAVGREATQVVALLSAIAAPTVAALVALMRSEKTNAAVAQVKKQTNGLMHALHDRMDTVEEKVGNQK